MSAKRKATAIMQHHKENISAPEPSEITEDDHYSSTLMKDAEKLKLMLLAWNYRNFSMQQQQQQQPSPVVSSVPGQLPATGAGQITTQQVVQQPTSVVQQQQQQQQTQQQQQQQQPPVSTNTVSAAINCSALSPSASNNGSAVATTNTTTSLPTVTSGQAACTTTNGSVVNAINNTISSVVSGGGGITESRNGKDLEMPELISVTGAAAASVAGATSEDMASLWASYTMSLKKTPSPGSNTPSRERDRDSSPVGEAGSAHDETSSSGNKEDEDDDDEDVDERLDPRHHDPERLKAFNMFVRLFVDENLDRIVPISKQPKEKIQAIIDSCTRQFPEFAERARKRIRTYLKSCRRNKRGREGASWDAARPTPAHLTSVQAEQILATACENESDNAKRMRVGLEPVSQPMPTLPAATQTDVRANMEHFGAGAGGAGAGGSGGVGGAGASAAAGSSSSGGNSTQVKSLSVGSIKREDTPPSTATSLTSLAPLTSLANLPNNAAAAAAVAAASLVSTGALSLAPSSKLLTNTCTSNDSKTHMSQATIVSSSTANGLGNAAAGAAPTAMYRPNFGQAFQRSGGPTVPPTLSAGLYPTQSFTSGFLSNGTTRPTDLSMKSTKPLLSHKLNATEMTAVRQLITGYRESAAFLLRSADELEQLLHQQP